MTTIRNPLEWGADQIQNAARHAEATGRSLAGDDVGEALSPTIRPISPADLREVLEKGVADFRACRSDVIFLCLIYPLVGLILARFAFSYDMLPLLFPLASGFALLGPAAAVGLYEMSRKRERGEAVSWADALSVLRAPSFGTIVVLGLILLGLMVLWLVAAQLIWLATLGPEPPASISAFLGQVFGTAAGWAMIVVGIAVGALFAVTALAISVVSFPMLVERDVGLGTAIATSVRAVLRNPLAMGAWGLIVAVALVAGTIPLFLGLVVAMPVLGHATWHLYRKVVAG